ncbi:histone H2A, sperm-like [Pararge aegeria]|uniref:Histone H2A n=2 Tax=Pararge aegeria TaxID=116150 RepID=A0A8S4RFW8_9NEOP|nr:histone H2A, sperm-like [Pararge aegeria]CAH2234575.1 jg15086 [Pararge aegeria aegeria]
MSSKAKKTSSKTRSSRAGLTFPVGRIHKMLKKGNFAPRIGSGASVFLAAVVEYLASEILDLASEVAFQNQKSRLVPRHLLFAIKNDEELSRMLTGVTISQGGVLPAINAQLLPKKTMKKQAESSQKSQQF